VQDGALAREADEEASPMRGVRASVLERFFEEAAKHPALVPEDEEER
jgi:hypothetical protein